ncbi:hypothetical protein C8Q70DRAFT_1021383 [Cubamyces menziesii]|nr:hypothetical protein C8Q70DRAFT_1021383 [Cubamyces menziesii]
MSLPILIFSVLSEKSAAAERVSQSTHAHTRSRPHTLTPPLPRRPSSAHAQSPPLDLDSTLQCEHADTSGGFTTSVRPGPLGAGSRLPPPPPRPRISSLWRPDFSSGCPHIRSRTPACASFFRVLVRFWERDDALVRTVVAFWMRQARAIHGCNYDMACARCRGRRWVGAGCK